MTLSGNEIEKMYEYVQQHGKMRMYHVGNIIPIETSNVGYKRWISTKNEKKMDVADVNLF